MTTKKCGIFTGAKVEGWFMFLKGHSCSRITAEIMPSEKPGNYSAAFPFFSRVCNSAHASVITHVNVEVSGNTHFGGKRNAGISTGANKSPSQSL